MLQLNQEPTIWACLPVGATAIDLHMGVVRTPARAIFKNNLNMLFLNTNQAIDTTCTQIDTRCNSNRHNILRNPEIGNDSRIIYKTQRRFLWNPDIQKCYNSKCSPPPAAIFYVFHDHGSLELLSVGSRSLCCNELCPRNAGFCRGSEMFSKYHHAVWLKKYKGLPGSVSMLLWRLQFYI